MRAEAVDMVVTAVEKHIGNYEVNILLDDGGRRYSSSRPFHTRLRQRQSRSRWTSVLAARGM